MMNKIKTHIICLIIILIISYFGHNFFIAIKFHHHINYSNFKKYLWLLNDSIKKDVDSVFFVGLERESDDLYEYIIANPSGKQFVTICNLKNIPKADLDAIEFNQNISLDGIQIYPAEKINLESNIRPEITIKSQLSIDNNIISVNLNHSSKDIRMINSENYKGFLGNINKMSLSDSRAKSLLLCDYGSRIQPTLFLFYYKSNHLYFILVNSEKKIDETIIKNVNLN